MAVLPPCHSKIHTALRLWTCRNGSWANDIWSNPMHDLMIAAVFLAMIAAPCVITLFRHDEEADAK